MKKLIPAIVMLLVSAVVLSTASYAWFTVGGDVTTSGMQVTAQAPASILIKGQLANDNWTEYAHTVAFDQAKTTLSPVSSHNAVDFWTPSDCYDDQGSVALNATFTKSDRNDTAHVKAYELQFKNNNPAEAGAVAIGIKSLTASDTRLSGAIRVAFIAGDEITIFMLTGTSESWVRVPVPSEEDPTLPSYTAESVAVGPISTNEGTFAEYAVGTDAEYGIIGTTPIVSSLDAQAEIAVSVLVWYEGQDSRCVSANSGLSDAIDIVFQIQDAVVTEENTTVTP